MAVKRTKVINTSRIMREIWTNRETTRINIARNLGLDKSTISTIVNDLIALGVIKETREGEAGPMGGRKPVHITLNDKYGCVLGIELRPESYTAVAVDLLGEVVFSKFEKMEIAEGELPSCLHEIEQRVERELSNCNLPLLGIGAGLPGVIDPVKGIIKYSIPLKIDSPLNLYDRLGKSFGVPFFIENDANACAWGELAFHRQKDLRDFIFTLVELRDIEKTVHIHEKTAVGFGIVIDGRVHYGYQHSAGEFRSILRGPENKGQFSLTDEEAFRIEEDPSIMARFIHELCLHIALFVNTFNLSHVFLGGNLDWSGNNVHDVLYHAIQENWPYPDRVNTQIAFSSLGERAVAYGAAGMVLERLFADLELMEGAPEIRSNSGSPLPGWPSI